MDHGESGSGTPFESMSHEEMLAWLDQANSGAIQGAADRLVSAAAEIRKIAEDLKVRPQWVDWKGEGANAFRTWSADLANSTLRLGDYSEGASKWLTQASNAIASAQAAIPRTQAGAQANLDAALAARNDPDASAVAQKSAETLIATQEANRQEAAAQMRKLAQTYSFSASQMDGLEKPAFPPPPQAIVPPDEGERDEGTGRDFGSGSATTGAGTAYAPAPEGRSNGAASHVNSPSGSAGSGLSSGTPSAPRSVDMVIDGVAVLPDTPSVPAAIPLGTPGGGRAEGGLPSAVPVLPGIGTSPTTSPSVTATGSPTGIARPSAQPWGAGGRSAGTVGRPSREGGIVGGRPVPQSPGRPGGGLPRGTVIGGESANGGRAPVSHGTSVGGGGAGQNGIVGGRRLAGATGGVVGGRPQPPGRTGSRPFTPGGSGLVRGPVVSPDGGRDAGQVGRSGGLGPSGSRTGNSRREGGQRPDYLTEDEETWQGGRRVVPPVID